MTVTPPRQTEDKTPEEAFRDLRAWADERLRMKGLLRGGAPGLARQEAAAAVTAEHIAQLKADIEALVKLEGVRGFWAQVGISTVFFVLGLAAGVVLPL